ncbi:uncharacterized protein LOC133549516 [Nerophis ophidion]|uniref:uncharacterized protein LOC133549516 n=1 Tax=Nerophis ophidion TaxID=159077 RepID=UPI002ADFAB1D|nr:uncharacterized protein LOC133549516 [Nerophis ophidion]
MLSIKSFVAKGIDKPPSSPSVCGLDAEMSSRIFFLSRSGIQSTTRIIPHFLFFLRWITDLYLKPPRIQYPLENESREREMDNHCEFYLLGNVSTKHLGCGGNVIHSHLTVDRNRRNKPLTGRIDRKSIIVLLLLLSGDTELNPGPITTRLMLSHLAKPSNVVANDAEEASVAAGPCRSYAKNISSPPMPAPTCSSPHELTCDPAVGGTTEDFTPNIGAVGGPEMEEDCSDTGEDSGSAADGVTASDDSLATIKVGSAEVLLTSPETLRVIVASPGPPTAYTGFGGLFVDPWSLFSTSPKSAKTTPTPTTVPTWPPLPLFNHAAPPSPGRRTMGLSPSPPPPSLATETSITTNTPPSSGQYFSPTDSDVLFGSGGLHIIHLNVNSLSGNKLDQIREMFHNNKIPRTIVNVVPILPMKPLRDVHKPTLGCLLQNSSQKEKRR